MKRTLAVLLVLVMVLATFAACGNGGTEAPPADPTPAPPADATPAPPADEPEETVTLRLSEIHSGEAHPAVIGHYAFADYARERSDGSLNVEVFTGGVLGSEMEVLSQVQMGTLEMIRLPAPIIANVEPNFNALMLPGVWDGRDAMFAALDGEIGTYFADMMKEHGLYILAWHDAGARSLYNSVRPIYTPEDLEGLRIRMQESPLMIRLMELMGGTPVPMGPVEVYTAIQTGLVDGAENNWPSYVTSFSHYEVARYFTENEHSRVPEAVVISLDVWESLSANQQEILREAAIHGARVQREAWAADEILAEERAVEAGAQVVRL
ncbi:MAG: TRAP transporter substrate-binding protein, partial [Oscillospiraceae bacterium]|nr:TRAP transporter substrate-binding protein [Oscillospiraceae bacterium]